MIPPNEWAMKMMGRLISYMIERINTINPPRNLRASKLRLQRIRGLMPYIICFALIDQAPQ